MRRVVRTSQNESPEIAGDVRHDLQFLIPTIFPRAIPGSEPGPDSAFTAALPSVMVFGLLQLRDFPNAGSDGGPLVPVPAIAIHASKDRSTIARAIDTNFEGAGLYDRVVTLEFDWDRIVPRQSYRGLGNLYRFLRRTAGNIGTASRMGMEFGTNSIDGLLGTLQGSLHRFLQWTVAAFVAMVLTTMVADLVVLTPAALYGLPTVTFAPIGWLATTTGWAKSAIMVGIAALVWLGGLRLMITMSPRHVIITLRSIGFLFMKPVMIFALLILMADWWFFLAVAGAVGGSAWFGGGLAAVTPWFLLFAGLSITRLLWTGSNLRGPVRAVLDMFRYLGEPGYRAGIQQALDRAIERARERTEEDEEFVLVGQGLGSVMALDSILHSRCWRTSDRVLLVTLGSPLRRYFLRFYPRTLFPESMQDVVDTVARRVFHFMWVNVYRPGDYVGGSLGLAPFNGRDVSTKQLRTPFGGHSDYWRDIEARRAFRRGLKELTAVQALDLPMEDAAHRRPYPPRPVREFRLPRRLRQALAFTVSFATFTGMLWWVATGSGVLAYAVEESLESSEHAVVVDAAATHSRATVTHDVGLSYVDHWEFEFTDPRGGPQKLQLDRDASDAFLAIPHRFDDRALVRHVRNGCSGGDLPAWLPPGNMDTRCTVQGVKLRYYPGNVTFFDLPDFPRERFGSQPALAWTEVGVVAALLSILAFIPVAFGVRAFAMLVG